MTAFNGHGILQDEKNMISRAVEQCQRVWRSVEGMRQYIVEKL